MTKTHQLVDVFSNPGTLEVYFKDGDIFDLKSCNVIDHSIYKLTGGWCCNVEAYLGNNEKKKKLFLPNSLVDIYENGIVKVVEKATGKILF
jgi:hypothetical protein